MNVICLLVTIDHPIELKPADHNREKTGQQWSTMVIMIHHSTLQNVLEISGLTR